MTSASVSGFSGKLRASVRSEALRSARFIKRPAFYLTTRAAGDASATPTRLICLQRRPRDRRREIRSFIMHIARGGHTYTRHVIRVATSRGVLSRRVRRHCFPHARFHAPSKCIHSRDSAVINGAVVSRNIKMSTPARRAVSVTFRLADNSANFPSSETPDDEKPNAIQIEARAFSTCNPATNRSAAISVALESSIREDTRDNSTTVLRIR